MMSDLELQRGDSTTCQPQSATSVDEINPVSDSCHPSAAFSSCSPPVIQSHSVPKGSRPGGDNTTTSLGLSPPSGEYCWIEFSQIGIDRSRILFRKAEANEICRLQLDEHDCSPEHILYTINYGDTNALKEIKHLLERNRRFTLWDKSLITDFANCLFGMEEAKSVIKKLFDIGFFDSDAELDSEARGTLLEPWAVAEDFTILLGPMAHYGSIAFYDKPYSVAVYRMIKFVNDLRDELPRKGNNDKKPIVFPGQEYVNEWKYNFGQTKTSSMHRRTTEEAEDIRSNDDLSLLWWWTSGVSFFTRVESALLGKEKYHEYFCEGDWKELFLDFQMPRAFLEKWLRMDGTEGTFKRSAFLSYLGFTDAQFEGKDDDFGPLGMLTAANILAGPFRIDFTRHPSQHLTFSGSRDTPVLKLLSFDKIKTLYIPQRVGIASAAGLPTLFLELIYSYILFFGADDGQSAKIAAKLKVDMDMIRTYQLKYSPAHADFQLHHFPIYASRLRYIIRKMEEWRPQSIRHLAVRPYRDPFSFYAFWFATTIGILSILGLGATLAQTIVAFKSLELQIQQMQQ